MPKGPLIAAIIFCVLSSLALAQENKVTIPVANTTDANTVYVQSPAIITTPANVLVINNYSDDVSNLYYFKDNRFRWAGKAERQYSRKNLVETYNLGVYDLRYNAIVASNSGNWVYNIELNPVSIRKKDQYVTQFNHEGVSRTFTINATEGLGQALQTVFCDDQYFYYLVTENGDELARSKKAAEKMILNRFDAKDFAYKRVVLELPPIAEGMSVAFWSYLGQTDSEKFLVSKSIDPDTETYVLTIAAFNSEGIVTRTFTIQPKLEKRFIRPANAIKVPISNYYQISEFDYEKDRASSNFNRIEHAEGSFANILFDAVAQHFYVFGLSGPKPYQKVGPINDGFFIIRYDVNGTRTWQLEQSAPPALTNEGFFRVHSTPGYRNVYLQVMPDKSISFHIQIKKTRYTWPISDDGKAGKHVVTTDTQDVGSPYEFTLTK